MRTSVRSARRHTVRATCASAAARLPPGEDELLQWRELGVEAFDRFLEALHVRVGDGDVPGYGELAAQVEKIVLDAGEAVGCERWKRFREQEADRRVELVDRSDRVDPGRVLCDARAVAQPRGAVVTGAGDDLGKAVAHDVRQTGLAVRRLPCHRR
jgi:hypothetical protein